MFGYYLCAVETLLRYLVAGRDRLGPGRGRTLHPAEGILVRSLHKLFYVLLSHHHGFPNSTHHILKVSHEILCPFLGHSEIAEVGADSSGDEGLDN